jgi:hypothetical protein
MNLSGISRIVSMYIIMIIAANGQVALAAGINSDIKALQSKIQDAQRAYVQVEKSKGKDTRMLDEKIKGIHSRIDSLFIAMRNSRGQDQAYNEMNDEVARLKSYIQSLKKARGRGDWQTVYRFLTKMDTSAKQLLSLSLTSPVTTKTKPHITGKTVSPKAGGSVKFPVSQGAKRGVIQPADPSPVTQQAKTSRSNDAGRFYSYIAKLEQVTLRQGTFTAAGMKWTCKDKRCTGQAREPKPLLEDCRALAEIVGKVNVFGHNTMNLNDQQIIKCNKGLRVKKQRPEGMVVRGETRDLPLWRVAPEEMRIAAEKRDWPPNVTSQGRDCNDSDPNIHPNQPESRCDGVDDNCNGEIDEGLRIVAYRDMDHDLFGDPESGFLACPGDVVGELTDNNFDCDDTDPTVNPAAGNCP